MTPPLFPRVVSAYLDDAFHVRVLRLCYCSRKPVETKWSDGRIPSQCQRQRAIWNSGLRNACVNPDNQLISTPEELCNLSRPCNFLDHTIQLSFFDALNYNNK